MKFFKTALTLTVLALINCSLSPLAEAQTKLDPVLVRYYVEKQTDILTNNLYMTWKLKGDKFDEKAESKLECEILAAIIAERELPTNNNWIPEQTEAMRIVYKKFCEPFLETGEFQDL
jgi:hypothetical protein